MEEQLKTLGDLLHFGQNGENPETIIVINAFNGNVVEFYSIIGNSTVKSIAVNDGRLKAEIIIEDEN